MTSTPHATPRHLRNRLMLAFAGFTLLVAAVFGLYVAVFAYSIEDMFFRGMLEREAEVQAQHHARTGTWTSPRESWIRIVEDAADLPDGIAAVLRKEPQRTEFPGSEDRHYHLHALAAPADGVQAWLVAEVSEQLVVRPQRGGLFQLLAWSGGIVVALALLLGWWLAKRISAPLSRLATLVDAAPVDGKPDARIFPDDFPDNEIGVLARGLEALMRRIDQFVTREREFTRDASHELRTPLAVIRSATERMAHEPDLSIATRRSMEHIRHSAAQLEQTVAALLTLAREDALPHQHSPSSLLPSIERVIVEQSPLLDHKPVEVDVAVAGDVMTTLPPAVLNILLSNLIGNAFAHTRAGRIIINASAHELRISNPGDGVRDADFLPFTKGDASTGAGLGLSIVQRLCERHGIAARIESGTERTIASIPLDWPAPAAGPSQS